MHATSMSHWHDAVRTFQLHDITQSLYCRATILLMLRTHCANCVLMLAAAIHERMINKGSPLHKASLEHVMLVYKLSQSLAVQY